MANVADEKGTSPPSVEIPNPLDSRSEPNCDTEKASTLEAKEPRSNEETGAGGDKVEAVLQNNENIVDWEGPEDIANPLNWGLGRKLGNIMVVSLLTLITPLASSMFAPGVSQVMAEFKVTNAELSSLVVSIYLLGFAFGPLAFSPLSEVYGRLPVYYSCNICFIVSNVACALSTNMNMLMGFRFLAGCTGSAPLTLGGGTISDLIPREKRGAGIAVFALGPLLGPVIGPVGGGFLTQNLGWRWVFWLLAITSGALQILAFALMQETNPVVLLDRKAKRQREESGDPTFRSIFDRGISHRELFSRSIVRPMKMILDPTVFSLAIFMAILYGYLYLLFTTFSTVFTVNYDFAAGTVGLSYMGIGVGFLVGVGICGFWSDRIVRQRSAVGDNRPENRLPPQLMIPGALCIPAGMFIYGWTAEARVFWIVPIMGTAIMGVGLLMCFMPIQTYLVDAFTIYSASALATTVVLRSAVGAVLPLAGQSMYETLGLGWGNSLLGFIALAMSPIPLIFYLFGERMRAHSEKRRSNW